MHGIIDAILVQHHLYQKKSNLYLSLHIFEIFHIISFNLSFLDAWGKQKQYNLEQINTIIFDKSFNQPVPRLPKFIKKVVFPDGKECLVGCGIYQMKMEKPFIQDVVDNAVRLIESKGDDAFADFRDKTGPFLFLDTYIFVDSPEGVEIVNAAQPSAEGKKLIALKDAKGEPAMRNYLKVALEKGSGWVDYQWYRPGTNSPAPKHTYVKKAIHAGKTYVVGAGFYD